MSCKMAAAEAWLVCVVGETQVVVAGERKAAKVERSAREEKKWRASSVKKGAG